MSKKAALIILDGWGKAPKQKSNAIANAKTPFVNYLLNTYPNSQLITSGESVGLPKGQMGNSEVGHTNIGAGRIVWQLLERINNDILENKFEKQTELKLLFEYATHNNKPLHLMGLVSNGGVHSHINHLKRICELAHIAKVKDVFIHAFTDGRDTDPKSGINFITELQQFIQSKELNCKIATLCGRYFAMDRDKRWSRIKLAYDMLVNADGVFCNDPCVAIEDSYNSNITDEFIKPVVICDENNMPLTAIKDGDAVFCFNFRTDRCREITVALTQTDIHEYNLHALNLYYVTMTSYDDSYNDVRVVYEKDNLEKTIGEVISDASKTQLRIAETEKYPHVTFFFSGGRENNFEGESRIMIPSPKIATYDLQPQMSAQEVTDAVLLEIKTSAPDFICLNFANPDMVGHTGVYAAVVKAIETVDSCLKQVVEAGMAKNYSFIIIADHGNADYMINDDGSPNTAHSLNPVPCILVDQEFKKISDGILADVAPTILTIMGIETPVEMTGRVLVQK